MKNLTIEQAVASYKETVETIPNNLWVNWVQVVNTSLMNKTWHGDSSLPGFSKDVYEHLSKEQNVSYADSE